SIRSGSGEVLDHVASRFGGVESVDQVSRIESPVPVEVADHVVGATHQRTGLEPGAPYGVDVVRDRASRDHDRLRSARDIDQEVVGRPLLWRLVTHDVEIAGQPDSLSMTERVERDL